MVDSMCKYNRLVYVYMMNNNGNTYLYCSGDCPHIELKIKWGHGDGVYI